MNDQEINIAIAETCGIAGPWTEQITPCGCDGQWDLFNPDGVRLPNYCNDLNAMHEAENTMTEQQKHFDYPVNLGAWVNAYQPIYATARQRAEAFLRTIGKWKEAAK